MKTAMMANTTLAGTANGVAAATRLVIEAPSSP
jgi:hypothetical protein